MTTKETLDLITWVAAIGSYTVGLITIVLVALERRRAVSSTVILRPSESVQSGTTASTSPDASEGEEP